MNREKINCLKFVYHETVHQNSRYNPRLVAFLRQDTMLTFPSFTGIVKGLKKDRIILKFNSRQGPPHFPRSLGPHVINPPLMTTVYGSHKQAKVIMNVIYFENNCILLNTVRENHNNLIFLYVFILCKESLMYY